MAHDERAGESGAPSLRAEPSSPADACSRAAAGPAGVVTTCGGCGADCAFRAFVEPDGRVRAETPVPGHPCEAPRLCGRGRRRLALPRLADERVEHPLRRLPDGSFERVSWEEAYAGIASRLKRVIERSGPRALALTTGVPSYHWRYARRLMWALGSPNVYTSDASCEASRLTGWLRTLGYSPESDLANTDYIVYFGRSPMDAASASMAEEVRAVRARGGKVVVVDPRRNSTVDHADLWLKVRPGHDLALLLGIAHVLIEEGLYDEDFVARHTTGFDEFAAAMGPYTAEWAAREAGVPEEEVLAVARGLGHARPRAVVDCGFHGGLGVAYANSTQASRMVALVDALLGSYGKLGGSLSPAPEPELGSLDPARFPAPARPAGCKVGADRYPMVDEERGLGTTIAESIELGELRALIAYASNPAAGYGNARDWIRVLEQLDLLVAVDIRMSETARIADYVLPEVTFLEADRGVGAAGGGLYYRNPVLPQLLPDARPADRIFRELAAACGVGRYFSFTADDLALAQVAPYAPEGQEPAEFLRELRGRGFCGTGETPLPRTGEPVILTPDKKVAFASDEWARAGQGRTPCWIPPLVEPRVSRGSDQFRLIAGNNPFASHTSSKALLAGAAETAEAAEAAGKGGEAKPGLEHERLGGGEPDRPAALVARGVPGRDLEAGRVAMAGVWMHEDRAAELGISEGDVVEVFSPQGSDRAVAHLTRDIHPAALFTTSSPGARSGMHARARAAVAGELGVGPLDHTPLRVDRLSGAALTQENVVRVRKAGPAAEGAGKREGGGAGSP